MRIGSCLIKAVFEINCSEWFKPNILSIFCYFFHRGWGTKNDHGQVTSQNIGIYRPKIWIQSLTRNMISASGYSEVPIPYQGLLLYHDLGWWVLTQGDSNHQWYERKVICNGRNMQKLCGFGWQLSTAMVSGNISPSPTQIWPIPSIEPKGFNPALGPWTKFRRSP